MYLVYRVHGTQQICLSRAGRGASNVHAASGPRLAQDDRAASGGLPVSVVSYLDSGDIVDAVHKLKIFPFNAKAFPTLSGRLSKVSIARRLPCPWGYRRPRLVAS